MTTSPDETPPPLDYHKPPRSPTSTLFLVLAILFALGVGGVCALAILFMGSDTYGQLLAFLLGIGLCLLVIGAIVAIKKGMSAAIAITVAAGCAFLLMLGLCSQFRFEL